MRFLAIGDLVSRGGLDKLSSNLANIQEIENIDFTIVNGENSIECRMDIAYVPDDSNLYENISAIDFIKFICDMYKTPI